MQNDYISALNTLNAATTTFNADKAPGTKDIVPPTVTAVAAAANTTSGGYDISFTTNEAGSYKYQIGDTTGTWQTGADIVSGALTVTFNVKPTASFATVYIQVSDASGNATIASADVGDADSTSAVASVGAAKYDTLAAAIAAATSGQTVKLLKDVTETLTAPTASSLTIDLGTHKLTMSNTASVVISGDKSLTIQNGSIESKGFTDGTLSNFNIQTNSSIALENVIFDTTGSALYPSGDAARVTVTNSEIKCGVYAVATNAAKVANYNIVITLTGSTFTSTYGYKNDASNKFDSCPVMINVPGTLNMSGCTVNGTRQGVLVRGGTATIQNSTINLTAQYTAGKDLYWSGNWGSGDEVPMAAVVVGNRNSAYQYPATCTLENTVVTAPSDYKAVYVYGMDAATRLAKLNIKGSSTNITGEVLKDETAENAAIVSVTGGTFSTDPSAYVAPGYEATHSENVWTVAKIGAESANANVQVDSNYYKTLSDAIAAATSGQTVKLLKNITLTGTITIDKTLILDLNGFNISDNTRVFEIKAGTLALGGSGTVSSTFATAGTSSVIKISAASGAAELVIGKSVTVYSATSYAISLFGSETNAKKLTVNGTVTSENTLVGDASAIAGLGTTSGNNTQITINGGAKVNSTLGTAIYHPQQGTLTVNGGAEITGVTGIEVKAGTVNISGGTITATGSVTHQANGNGTSTTGYAVALVENAGYGIGSAVSVNITGGTFTGPVEKVQDSARDGEETLSITGGTFSSNPSAYVNTTGYTVTQGTSTWTVAAKPTT